MTIDWDLLNEINANEVERYLKLVKEDCSCILSKNAGLDAYAKDIADSDIPNLEFIRHLENKECDKNYKRKLNWEFFAKVLIFRGFNNTKDITGYLFAWLKDFNWPGAVIIFDYLLTMPKDDFLIYYEKACLQAIKEKNETWLDNLVRLAANAQIDLDEIKDKALVKLLKEIMQKECNNKN